MNPRQHLQTLVAKGRSIKALLPATDFMLEFYSITLRYSYNYREGTMSEISKSLIHSCSVSVSYTVAL